MSGCAGTSILERTVTRAAAEPTPSPGERRLAPVVSTAAGDVQGVLLSDTNAAYLGIPYAEPPVGELRFAAPVKRSPWQGVRDATSYGATPLRDFTDGITAIPEPSFPGDDTLLVNVFTPQTSDDGDAQADAGAGLPVYVWIHGGGFTTGSPSSPWYETGSFPRDGVVVVSISYRLGFDGFGLVDGAPANRAVLDWLLALEWVQENVAAFGGDPARVTIGGQSAGGTAVLTLLTMPVAQGLFSGVIAESPAASDGTLSSARRHGADLASRVGAAPGKPAMLAVSERAIFDAQTAIAKDEFGVSLLRGLARGTRSFMDWVPVVDGELIPYSIDDALARGIGADKTLLIGATANEADAFSSSVPAALRRVPVEFALLTAGLGPRAAAAYARETPGRTPEVFGRLLSDATFRLAVVRAVEARERYAADALGATGGAGAAAGDAAPSVGGTWVYDFRLPSSDTGQAGHCIELPFVWDCLDAENVVERNTGPNPPQAVADRAHAAWVSFIADGDPGWSRSRAGSRAGMVFTAQPFVGPVFAREHRLLPALPKPPAPAPGRYAP